MDKEKNKLLFYSHINPVQQQTNQEEDLSSDIGNQYRRGEPAKLEEMGTNSSGGRYVGIEDSRADRQEPHKEPSREKIYENLKSVSAKVNPFAGGHQTGVNVSQARQPSYERLEFGEAYCNRYQKRSATLTTESSGSTLFKPCKQSIDKWQKRLLTMNTINRTQARNHETETQTAEAPISSSASSEEIEELDDNADLFKCFTNIVDDDSSKESRNSMDRIEKSAYCCDMTMAENCANYFCGDSCTSASDSKKNSTSCSSYSTSPSNCADSACESCGESSSSSCALCKLASRRSSTSGASSASSSLSKTSSSASSNAPKKLASLTSSFTRSTSFSSVQLLDCQKARNRATNKPSVFQPSSNNRPRQPPQALKPNYNCFVSADDINGADLNSRAFTDKDRLIQNDFCSSSKLPKPSILNNSYEKSKSVDLMSKLKAGQQRHKVAFILDKDITKRNTILNGIKKTIALKEAKNGPMTNSSRRLDNRTYSIEQGLNPNDPSFEKYNRAKMFFENLDKQASTPLIIKAPSQTRFETLANELSRNRRVLFESNLSVNNERKMADHPYQTQASKYAQNKPQNKMFTSQKSSAAEARSTTYARCYAKISPRDRKRLSPPPKAQIAPNGLLPPPLPPRLPPNVASMMLHGQSNGNNHFSSNTKPLLPNQNQQTLLKTSQSKHVPEYHKLASNTVRHNPNPQYPAAMAANGRPGGLLKSSNLNPRENSMTARATLRNEYDRFVNKNVAPVAQTYLKAVQEKQLEKGPVNKNTVTKSSNQYQVFSNLNNKNTSNFDGQQLNYRSANFHPTYPAANAGSSSLPQNQYNSYTTHVKLSSHHSRSNVSLDLIDLNDDLSKPSHPYQSNYQYAMPPTNRQASHYARTGEQERYKQTVMTMRGDHQTSRPSLNQMKNASYHQGVYIPGY